MLHPFLYRLISRLLLVWCGIFGFASIATERQEDKKQWLCFWTLYSVFETITTVTDYLDIVVPFYYEIKLAFLIFIGPFYGATRLYSKIKRHVLFVQKICLKYEKKIKGT